MHVVPVATSTGFGLFEKDEIVVLIAVLQDLMAVQTDEDFKDWSSGSLQDLLPHSMMVAGIATIDASQIRIQKMIVKNWPLSYFDALKTHDGAFQSPIMTRWQQRHLPQLYDPAVSDTIPAGLWRDVFDRYQLNNMAAHGVRDLNGSHASYFNFSQIPVPLTSRHSHLLALLTPHMHVALSRAFTSIEPYPAVASVPSVPIEPSQLTPRELVVLYWIGEGKTNWEIAKICRRSQHTIKNQVECLLRKLQVSNRAHAIHKASRLNISLEKYSYG
jgi:transcriptional regulator EpsA